MTLLCVTCKLPLKCEACGVAEADKGVNYINDSLEAVAIRLCDRCVKIHAIPPAKRIPSDERALEINAMSIRNLPAYEKLWQQGSRELGRA